MPRKPRPLDRDEGVMRDANLIIIASEDRYAVKQYFSRFKTRRVQIRVLPTDDCRSAPQHVIERLNQFVKEHVTEVGDTFWLCIDSDRWPPESLSKIIGECFSKSYQVAMSNPCFELWILLHFESVPNELASCDQVCEVLRGLFNGYSKKCCRTIGITGEMVRSAMGRARSMDKSTSPSVPSTTTHVYKILDVMIQKEAIELV